MVIGKKVFLMTKIDGRSKKEALRQLDQSLNRLQVEHIDLVQHHEMIRFEDPHRIFDEDGANQALVEAKAAGKIRFIGFTGHKDPHIICTHWQWPKNMALSLTRCKCR